ncbi:MAG: hypothetical protein U0838_05055 [Chloroflexota bacterium]
MEQITGDVWTIRPLADGRIYIGGDFANDGPGKCDAVCWWDPASESWNPVGGSGAPDNVFNDTVTSMAVVGSRVYVGGLFGNAGNSNGDFVAVWNGTA